MAFIFLEKAIYEYLNHSFTLQVHWENSPNAPYAVYLWFHDRRIWDCGGWTSDPLGGSEGRTPQKKKCFHIEFKHIGCISMNGDDIAKPTKHCDSLDGSRGPRAIQADWSLSLFTATEERSRGGVLPGRAAVTHAASWIPWEECTDLTRCNWSVRIFSVRYETEAFLSRVG